MQRLAFLLLLSVSLSATAQHGQQQLAKADQLAWGNLYNQAIPLYKKAYAKARPESKSNILFSIGECYRKQANLESAAAWYTKSVKAGNDDPLVWLRLAEAHRQNGDYAKAREAFEYVLTMDAANARAQRGLEACAQAETWLGSATRHVVEPLHAANSAANDLRPYFDTKRNTLYFTSDREGSTGQLTNGFTGRAFHDMYAAKQSRTGKWSTAQPLRGALNTEVGEGAAVVSADGKTMFYTRCGFKKRQITGCELFVSKRQGQSWLAGERIEIADDTCYVGQPFLTFDERAIVFASDMAGGFGGRDLWLITKNDTGWSSPLNLGPEINTAGNEGWPSVDAEGQLYFASDGHLGIGGLDIFVAHSSGLLQWSSPHNLQSPINSCRDDFALIATGDGRGMFTSNRAGGKGGDDIYTFFTARVRLELKGIILDADTKQPIEGATLQVTGSDGLAVTLTADAEGIVGLCSDSETASIKKDVTYDLLANHPEYIAAEGSENTLGVTESTIYEHVFWLTPAAIDTAFSMPTVLYDYDSHHLRPEASDSLDYLYRLLENNPNLAIRIEAHTDAFGSHAYNLGLSRRRAQACVQYLVGKGINPGRLDSEGFGESRLIFTEAYIAGLATEEEREAAHQFNRRTEFSILSRNFGE